VTSTSPAGAPGPDGAAPLVELREVTVLSGLQRPSAGELLVAGRPVTHLVAGGDELSRLTDSLRAVRPTPGATRPGCCAPGADHLSGRR
jgi:hypothetical protein